MQHEAATEKSDTQNKAPSTPLADAVAKVERALKSGGLRTSHLTVTDEGHGSFEINASIVPNESIFDFFKRATATTSSAVGDLAD